MPPKAKLRRRLRREKARQLLEDLVAGKADVFWAYGRLFSLWDGNDPIWGTLRPLFKIPGIDPSGSFSLIFLAGSTARVNG
jgi:hypothetical protein